MRFAIKTRPEHQTWAQIRDVWVAADEVELFESAWNWDHFYPLTEPYNGPNFEAWTMIAALAQATRRIRLGCQVTGMIYRHPAVLANMAATTDIISGGRLELGVGAGWNQMECDAYGIELPPLRERFDRFDEGVEAIIALLSQETSTLDGRYVKLTDARCEPKPVQRPHPPITIGGRGRTRTLRTAARLAQQWNAITPEPGGLAQPQGDAGRALRQRRPGSGRDHLLGQCPGRGPRRDQAGRRAGRGLPGRGSRPGHHEPAGARRPRHRRTCWPRHSRPWPDRAPRPCVMTCRSPAGTQARHHGACPGASTATHSTWWVMGKMSNARSPSSRQPSPANTAMSLARVAGSHDT